MLEIDFLGMKFESESVFEEFRYFRNACLQVFLTFVHQYEIVHIPPIVADFQGFLHERIELVKIEVRKELAREVPDRKPVSGLSVKEALVLREPDPIRPVPVDTAILCHIALHNGLCEGKVFLKVVF